MYLHPLHFHVFPACFPVWVLQLLPCIYIPYFACVGSIPYMSSIPCMGDLFALRALSPPPCTYIHCFIFSCMDDFSTEWHSPHHHVPTFPAFPCIPSMVPCMCPHYSHVPTLPCIHCLGDLFPQRAQSPQPCPYILCISTAWLHV